MNYRKAIRQNKTHTYVIMCRIKRSPFNWEYFDKEGNLTETYITLKLTVEAVPTAFTVTAVQTFSTPLVDL